MATLAGGLFGGVIQSTPYIGHPAYKAMGARAAYTLATALFMGGPASSATSTGFYLIPKAVVFPILVFVGLEITAQSFHATPRATIPAVALACVPALAYLALIPLNQVLPELAEGFAGLRPQTQHWVQTVVILSGGFIVTSLLWATTLAHLIDGKVRAASARRSSPACSPSSGSSIRPSLSPIVGPAEAIRRLEAEGRYDATSAQTPYHWAAAYGAMAATWP